MVFPSGALLKRELLVQMRTVRSLLCFLALALVAVWIVALNWPSRQNMVWSMIPFASSQIFAFFTFLLLIGAGLFIPAVAATSIQGEKERRNWDMLSITLIRPWGIVFGKLLCIVGWYIMLVAALAPVVSVVFFLIGLDMVQVSAVLALIVLTSLTLACLGLACSARFRSTPACVIASYGCMVIFMGVIAFPVWMLLEYLEIYDEEWLFSLSPLVMMGGVIGGMMTWKLAGLHLAYQAVFACAGLLSAWRLVRRKDVPEVSAPRETKHRFRLPLRRGRGSRPIGDWSNAILAREARWGRMSRRIRPTLVFCVTAIVFGVMSVTGIATQEGFGGNAWAYDWIQIVVVEIFLSGVTMCALFPAMAANLFTKERDSGNMDFLRMTLITPAQFVRGKFLAGLRHIGVGWIAFVIGSLPILYLIWTEPSIEARFARDAWLRGALTILVAGTFAVVVAITVSIVVKRTLTAIMVTQFINGVVFVGLFFFFGFGLDALDTGNRFEELVWFSSPGTAFVGTLMGDNMPLAAYHWGVNLLVYAMLSLLLFLWAGRFFARHRMQEK